MWSPLDQNTLVYVAAQSLSKLGDWKAQRELFSARLALERQGGEAFVVIVVLPRGQGWHSGLETGEGVPAPKLFLVSAVTALDLAVLLGMSRLDVPIPDPGLLNDQEGQREFSTVVGLKFPNGEWQGSPDLAEEVQARPLVLAPIQP